MSNLLVDQLFRLAVTRSEQDVLQAMARHANNDGTSCYPSLDTICDESKLGRRQVQRIIKSLECRGVLQVVAYPNGGRGKSTEYNICLDVLPKIEEKKPRTKKSTVPIVNDDIKTPFTAQEKGDIHAETVTFEPETVTSSTQNGDIHDKETVTFDTQNGVTMTPHYVIDSVMDDSVIDSLPNGTLSTLASTPLESRLAHTHAQAREALALTVGGKIEDVGYVTFDGFFDAFWQEYPLKIHKPTARLVARGIEPCQWRAVVDGAANYALSSIAMKEGGKWRRAPDKWLEDEDWEAYQDGPMIDKPPERVLTPAQQDRADVWQMAAMVEESLRTEDIAAKYGPKPGGGYLHGTDRKPVTRLDEIRARGIHNSVEGDFRQVGEGFAFPGKKADDG